MADFLIEAEIETETHTPGEYHMNVAGCTHRPGHVKISRKHRSEERCRKHTCVCIVEERVGTHLCLHWGGESGNTPMSVCTVEESEEHLSLSALGKNLFWQQLGLIF